LCVEFTTADQATNNDYHDERQKALLGADGFSGIENRFLGKGHLTPDGDFKKDENCEKSFTYIYTNAAPQWQLFNAGNWAALEGAIRSYADRPTQLPPGGTRTLYIFTGTGGGFLIFRQRSHDTERIFRRPAEKLDRSLLVHTVPFNIFTPFTRNFERLGV